MSEPLTPEARVRAELQYLRGFPRQVGPFEWAWSPDKMGAYVSFEDAVDAFLTTLAEPGASEGLHCRGCDGHDIDLASQSEEKGNE